MNLRPIKKLNEDIQLQKAEEAKAGLFLAKKVDALREQVADEQLAHDTAIADMATKYQIALGEFTSKKSALDTEISYLEAKRAALQAPLDAEWNKVNEITKNNAEKSILLEEKEGELIERESYIARKEKEIKTSKIHTENTLSEIEALKDEAEKLYLQRKEQLDITEENCISFEKEYEKTLLSLKQKEQKLTYDIQHYKDFESRLKRKEAELTITETRLFIKELK